MTIAPGRGTSETGAAWRLDRTERTVGGTLSGGGGGDGGFFARRLAS